MARPRQRLPIDHFGTRVRAFRHTGARQAPARMKICHVITGLGTGGAQAALYRLVQTLRSPDFEHVVVALGAAGNMSTLFAEAAELHHLGMHPGRLLPHEVLRLRRLLRNRHYDVIQSWMYHANLMAAMAGWGDAAPVVWNIRHSLHALSHEKRATRWVIRAGARLSRRPARIIFNAAVSRTQHVAFGYDAARSVVIPNGFDTAEFAPRPAERARIRAELGIPDAALAVGLVARVHPMKDHATFLHAARRLGEKHPRSIFVLVGEGADGANRELGALIDQLDLRDRVRLCGRRSDIAAIDNALDIAASSSAWGEAFPNATAEAMACGVPCVVTDVGDAPAIVDDTGAVVPPRDPVALGDAWAALAALGAEARRALGQRARARVIRHYAIDAGARRYADLYRDIAEPPCATH
jgi:glycosyltransferase involved in cell wall biosynthesis